MSNEELVKEIQKGIKPAENIGLLYDKNKGYIHSIAKKYQAYEDIEDLMQEAYFGLYEAVKRYEDTGGVLFMTYAGYWIRQSIARYIENNGRVVRLPVHICSRINQYKKVVNVYKKELNRLPTKRELCIHLKIGFKQLESLESIIYEFGHLSSLDSQTNGLEGDEITLGDTVKSDQDIEGEVIEKVYNNQLKIDLRELINASCDEIQANIINKRYWGNMTLKAIGESMGVTVEAIRSRESQALRRLRVGKASRIFRSKYEDELCLAWKGGANRFNRTWTSSTEDAAIAIYEKDKSALKG